MILRNLYIEHINNSEVKLVHVLPVPLLDPYHHEALPPALDGAHDGQDDDDVGEDPGPPEILVLKHC